MVRVRDLNQAQVMNLARFVRDADGQQKSERQILLNLQISKEDLDYLRKLNDRTDHPVEREECPA